MQRCDPRNMNITFKIGISMPASEKESPKTSTPVVNDTESVKEQPAQDVKSETNEEPQQSDLLKNSAKAKAFTSKPKRKLASSRRGSSSMGNTESAGASDAGKVYRSRPEEMHSRSVYRDERSAEDVTKRGHTGFAETGKDADMTVHAQVEFHDKRQPRVHCPMTLEQAICEQERICREKERKADRARECIQQAIDKQKRESARIDLMRRQYDEQTRNNLINEQRRAELSRQQRERDNIERVLEDQRQAAIREQQCEEEAAIRQQQCEDEAAIRQQQCEDEAADAADEQCIEASPKNTSIYIDESLPVVPCDTHALEMRKRGNYRDIHPIKRNSVLICDEYGMREHDPTRDGPIEAYLA
eukprot:792203_1